MTTDTKISLSAGDAGLTIDPENGCRVTSLRLWDTELLRQGAKFGMFPMVPWCGRIALGQLRSGGERYQMPINSAPHAIHGTGRNTAWTVVRSDKRSAALTYDLVEPWPFPGRVTQTIELDENSLTLTMGVEATADSFPAQAGWHPWFQRNLARGKDVELAFEPAWQEERGADYLPTGRRITPLPGPWDDCFGMPDGVDVTLTWPGAVELRITSRAEWAVIYDEQAEAVCVEAQSGPPNGLNTLPRLVTPTDPLEISATWTWQPLA